jgi:hypothetical protein
MILTRTVVYLHQSMDQPGSGECYGFGRVSGRHHHRLRHRRLGPPREVVNEFQRSPMWAQLEARAQSAVYDAVITTDLQLPTAAMAAVSTPTLVLQGDPTWPIFATAAAGIAHRLPNATHRILPVEAVHGIDPGGTAAAIREFEQ